ncbi:hypothetical protein MJH12_00160, partial [bacterium]|nr:hypothetical protein [bacterium]
MYTVPQSLRSKVGFDSMTISATAPGETDPSAFYIALEGSGDLELLSILKLKGEFAMVFTDDSAKLTVGAILDMPMLEPISATGTLGLADGGLYGSLQVGAPTGSDLIKNSVMTLSGSFLFQFNTTSKTQKVKSITFSADGKPTGFEDIDLESSLLYIKGTAKLVIAGAIEMSGSASLKLYSRGFEADLDMTLDLGSFGGIQVFAAAAFLDTADEGTIFQMIAGFNVELGMGIVGIKAAAVISINTSKNIDFTKTIKDLSTADLTDTKVITAKKNTLFSLELDGKLKIVAFDVAFKGGISVINDVFELRIDNASIDFFGSLSIKISGYFKSDGNFSLTGAVDFGINLGILELSAGMSMTISNTVFKASVYGSLDLHIDMGFFEINETLAGFSGEIEITAASAYLAASVTIAGMSISGDYTWSFGAPPIIANKSGDVLYLNMGQRGIDHRGDLYKDIDNESYNITETNGVLSVTSLGVTKTYTGIKTIIAHGGAGKDSINIGKNVTAKLQLDGGDDDDSFVIMGGTSTSIIDGGAGNDELVGGFTSGIHYYGGSGDDTFIGGDGAEYVDLGLGSNTIIAGGGADIITLSGTSNSVKAGEGKDIIYLKSGSNTIDLGAGDDIIYADLGVTGTIVGGSGYDQVILATFASSSDIELRDHEFFYDTTSIKFDDTLDIFKIKDTSNETILKNTADYSQSFGATDFVVEASGVLNVDNVTLVAPTAHFSFTSIGIQGTLNTELAQMTVINTGTADKANITIREKDSLEIISDSRTNGGLYTNNGFIDVELAGKEAFFNLSSGVISTVSSGGNITIIADDIDFHSGHNKVSGTGQLKVATKSSDQFYRVGGAGESVFGNDFSSGDNNGSMNFSMSDFSALNNGFSLLQIGEASDTVTMYIGDIEDKAIGAATHSAKLNDEAKFFADTINIVGDVQSSEKIVFQSRLIEVQKQNINDGLGAPDSGINAKEVQVIASEQMLLSGWVKATDLIDIDIIGSTGTNSLVTFGAEINSFRADQGSVLATYGNNATINLTTSASIVSATSFDVFGTNSSIVANAGTSIKILEGATISAGTDNSSINLNATTYMHIDTGAAVIAGAKFDYSSGTPVAVKTGTNATLTLTSTKEMKLAGSITSSGAMNLDGGSSSSGYADYFDTIPGKVLAERVFDQTIINELNLGNINSTLETLFNSKKIKIKDIELGNVALNQAVSVSSLENYLPFTKLTAAQQEIVATALGYTIHQGTNYYNSDTHKLVSDFTQGSLPYVAAGSSMSALGYTQYSGVTFYNPNTNSLAISFTQGDVFDYDNTKVSWGAAGAPSSNASFDSLSAAQKLKVGEYLGYKTDDGKRFYNYDIVGAKKVVETFTQGVKSDYSNSQMFWGSVAKPTANAGFSSLSTAQKAMVAKSLGYDVYENGGYFNANAAKGYKFVTSYSATQSDFDYTQIDFGGIVAPADDVKFEDLTIVQRDLVLDTKGYTKFDGIIYFKSADGSFKITFTDYSGVDFGDEETPTSGTKFDKLTVAQQDAVLTSKGYKLYSGLSYINSAAAADKQYIQALVEGTDYNNTDVKWSAIEIPANDTLFEDLSNEQKFAVIKSLGYEKYESTVYFKLGAGVDKELVTTFIEGRDYNNNTLDFGSSSSVKGNRWLINDGRNKFMIYALDNEGDGVIDKIQIQEAHKLVGQRGYGFLLTGTITSLDDNNNMVIASVDDTIIRGNINLFGVNSDLTIQSDNWVYFEGSADVTGDFTILGGMALDGSNLNGANASGDSVYIHSTATLNTKEAATTITIKGGQDVDINGRVVAGGLIGSNGVTFTGNGDSNVIIEAGQQVYIDSSINASKNISISTTGAVSSEDSSNALILTTAGGLIAAGQTSTNVGSNIVIDTVGNITIMGNILSGGNVAQTFDSNGVLLSEITTYTNEDSVMTIESDGQTYIGGIAKTKSGGSAEVGGILKASQQINLIGGTSSDGIGVKLPGAAHISVHNADGKIYIKATQDAEVNGLLVAGGEIIDSRDSLGKYIGSKANTFDGASTIEIISGQQIRVGRDLLAGLKIDLRGGIDPVDSTDFSGNGILLGGTVHLKTWEKNSIINLSASGDTKVLAPAWTETLVFDDFTEFADGHISQDVTLKVSIDLGSGFVEKDVVILASNTSSNSGIASLKEDIQNSLNAAFSFDASDPKVVVRLDDGRFMLTGAYKTKVNSNSINANLLGIKTNVDLESSRTYALDAKESGSVINIGQKDSPNGKIYLAGKVRAYKAINLYSGTKGRVAHELIADCRSFIESTGIEVEDIAKRLIDYGYHAPTVSFPVVGT